MKRNTQRYTFITLITIISIGTSINILITYHLWNQVEHHPIEHHIKPGKTNEINPFKEYESFCEAINKITQQYPLREIQGFISEDNRTIVTAVGSIYKVIGPKPIIYEGKYYLAWNKRTKPGHSYFGVIDYKGSEYLFIPIKAMFHSHVIDGTLSEMDLNTARKLPHLKHLLVKKDQIVSFNQHGPTSTLKFTENACQLMALSKIPM